MSYLLSLFYLSLLIYRYIFFKWFMIQVLYLLLFFFCFYCYQSIHCVIIFIGSLIEIFFWRQPLSPLEEVHFYISWYSSLTWQALLHIVCWVFWSFYVNHYLQFLVAANWSQRPILPAACSWLAKEKEHSEWMPLYIVQTKQTYCPGRKVIAMVMAMTSYM